MTEKELLRAVAFATNETIREIRRHGFSLVDPREKSFELEPDESMPSILDWDEVQSSRMSLFP